MNELYIKCQPWQLESVRNLLKEGETVGTNSYCFRPNTYVINHERGDNDQELVQGLLKLAIKIPLQ
jgi:hypothetical protein